MVARKPAVDRETLQLIKQIILEEAENLGVKVEKIILFGSRARGEAREDSDYDILVITREKINRRRKHELATRISRRIAKELLVPVDIVIRSRDEWRAFSATVGTIEEVAASEGIPV